MARPGTKKWQLSLLSIRKIYLKHNRGTTFSKMFIQCDCFIRAGAFTPMRGSAIRTCRFKSFPGETGSRWAHDLGPASGPLPRPVGRRPAECLRAPTFWNARSSSSTSTSRTQRCKNCFDRETIARLSRLRGMGCRATEHFAGSSAPRRQKFYRSYTFSREELTVDQKRKGLTPGQSVSNFMCCRRRATFVGKTCTEAAI